jgi:transposase
MTEDGVMINGFAVNQAYLATGFTDRRKAINGLSLIVSEQRAQDPFSGRVFVFCNRARAKLKILYRACNGFRLSYRRLDKGKFQWPGEALNQQPAALTVRELQGLREGLSCQQAPAHKRVYGLQNNGFRHHF